MADNITAKDASAVTQTFASDDISGVHYPKGKLSFGANDSATDVTTTTGLPVQLVNSGLLDSFGHIQAMGAFNDIDVQFYRDVPANLISVTTSGGGAATQTTGLAQFSTSTGTTGSSVGVSLDTVSYRSGGEVYVYFTAAWLDGGVSGCNQRIGLYDANNGFFMGYEGGTFYITPRVGASDSGQVAKASWNVDTLTGAAGSRFTRAGTPEAIDLTKLNVFRIRFGWLGAAPIRWEVLSPDGEWVLFHIIRQPNNSATPSINTVDLPMRIDLTKTSGATNIRMNTACWGAGKTYDNPDINFSGTLGTTTNSVINIPISGLSSCHIRCGTSTTGAFIIETTVDGLNWSTSSTVVQLSTVGTPTVIYGANTPTAGTVYKVSVAATRGLRIRTSSTLGATANFWICGEVQNTIANISPMAPAPHNIGYAPLFKTVQATTAQTGTAILTPTSGKRLVITSYQIQAYGTTAFTLQVWYGGSADTTYTRGTDAAIFDGEFAPSTTNKPGVVQTGVWMGTTDFVLRYTTNTTGSVTISVWGYEV